MVIEHRFTLTAGESKQRRVYPQKYNVYQRLVLASLFFNIYTYDLPFTFFRKFTYAKDLILLQYSGIHRPWRQGRGKCCKTKFKKITFLSFAVKVLAVPGEKVSGAM